MFLLEVFQNVFPNTQNLFKVLQKKRLDIAYSNSKVQEVNNILKSLRNDEAFGLIWGESLATSDNENVQPIRKRRKVGSNEQTESVYRMLFFEILDHLSEQIALEALCFVELLNPKKASVPRNSIPKAAFSSWI